MATHQLILTTVCHSASSQPKKSNPQTYPNTGSGPFLDRLHATAIGLEADGLRA